MNEDDKGDHDECHEDHHHDHDHYHHDHDHQHHDEHGKFIRKSLISYTYCMLQLYKHGFLARVSHMTT